MLPINMNLIWLVAGTFAALSIGTAVRFVALRNAAADVLKQRIDSLKTWWLLALFWSIAAMLGQIGAAVLLGIASVLAMREYLKLVGTNVEIGGWAIAVLIASGVIHFALVLCGGAYSETAKWFLPTFLMIGLGATRAVTASTTQTVRITARLYWGAMLMIYGLSHALFLFEVGTVQEPIVGSAGWFLFLVLLTETNDIMQALVGRKFGARKITPVISPNKSLAGLLGGMLATVILSCVLAPFLTTFTVCESWLQGIGLSIVAGMVISIFGFLGDINMSAIKRDAGVKDGSTLLPGMGGVIDRIDSLTFAAPVFFYFVEATT